MSRGAASMRCTAYPVLGQPERVRTRAAADVQNLRGRSWSVTSRDQLTGASLLERKGVVLRRDSSGAVP